MNQLTKATKFIAIIATFTVTLGFAPAAHSAHARTSSIPNNYEPLTQQSAQGIANGSIRLENSTRPDALLTKHAALNPEDDPDGDGIPTNKEIYTYQHHGHTYYNYYSHPLLKDSDGDGMPDGQDPSPLAWDITPRDMALFSELSYRDDAYIRQVLTQCQPLHNRYKNRNEYALMHNELAPFWKVKATYHYRGGFDAVLFDNVSPYPFLKQHSVQVLAIRGTSSFNDYDDDLAIGIGHNPDQARDVENLMHELDKTKQVTNLYITGHSLGGYLAQRALIRAKGQNFAWMTSITTFNAPQIWGNGLQRWLRDVARSGNALTQQGYAHHYKVDNDRVISSVGNFEGAFSIGNSANGHGSRSYFEPRMNSFPGFSLPNRGDISGTGQHTAELDCVCNMM